jgi:thiol-disulfide isomerase/thioredoxin
MRIRSKLLSAAVVGVLAATSLAQDGAGPAVGDDAPPVLASAWLNTEFGGSPLSAGRADEQVLMIEFWGTWCAPCVRAMPEVQKLHERFLDKGVVVVAVTREEADVARPFLEEHGYTMPVACDTAQDTIRAFGVRSWPTTVVVDREGIIAYIGGPAGAKRAVEKALGLEDDAAALLTAYLDALPGKDDAGHRSALERLVEKAPSVFDLSAWASGAGGADAEKVIKVSAEDKLDRCAKAWAKGDAEQRQAVLDALVASHTASFDLRGWARARFAAEFPLTKAELEELLAAKAYGVVVDALLDRAPSGAVLGTAKKHDGFVAHCRTGAPKAYKVARKGVMCVEYAFQDGRLTPENNEAFWADLSVSGLMTTEDKKSLAGVAIGGAMVLKDDMSDFADRNLARFLLMDAIGNGGKLKLAGIEKGAAKERARIVKSLKRKYG